MIYLDQKPGRTAQVNGKEYLFCSGYNYLGVNHDPEFMQLIAEGLAKYGWLFPSSRISNTRLRLFEECEALLSSATGMEDTVLLSSGFNAGRLAIQNKSIDNAPESHPAILHRQSQDASFREWSRRHTLNGPRGNLEHRGLASDSVNPLTATIYDFSFLRLIQSNLSVVLDDSHGIGIIGNGRGISSQIPENQRLDYIFTYSLSKAFGIMGGAVSCSREEAERIRRQPEYAAVTPLSPAQLFAFIHGQSIYAAQLAKLKKNIATFVALVQELPGIHYHPDLPIFVLDDRYREEEFLERQIIISSFAYPDPQGQKLNRIVISALHTPADLERLSDHLKEISQTRSKSIT